MGVGVGGVSHGTLGVPLSKGEDSLFFKTEKDQKQSGEQEGDTDQDMIIYVKKNSFL